MFNRNLEHSPGALPFTNNNFLLNINHPSILKQNYSVFLFISVKDVGIYIGYNDLRKRVWPNALRKSTAKC